MIIKYQQQQTKNEKVSNRDKNVLKIDEENKKKLNDN